MLYAPYEWRRPRGCSALTPKSDPPSPTPQYDFACEYDYIDMAIDVALFPSQRQIASAIWLDLCDFIWFDLIVCNTICPYVSSERSTLSGLCGGLGGLVVARVAGFILNWTAIGFIRVWAMGVVYIRSSILESFGRNYGLRTYIIGRV